MLFYLLSVLTCMFVHLLIFMCVRIPLIRLLVCPILLLLKESRGIARKEDSHEYYNSRLPDYNGGMQRGQRGTAMT